jgi:hypothetical protein
MAIEVLLYISSIIIFIWGIAHLIPTKSIVDGFGEISTDNKRIITMEWIAVGISICFIGIIGFMMTYFGYSTDIVGILIFRLLAVMLFVLATVSLFTGARTAILPIKMCPIIMIFVGLLFLIGTIL